MNLENITKEEYQQLQRYYEMQFKPFLLNLSEILAEVVANRDKFALLFFIQAIQAMLIHAAQKIEDDKGKMN